MNDLAAALASSARKLEPFEGREVIKASIEMPSAAGGLREPLAFEPVEIHHGDEGYIVLHWKCTKVRFDPIKDTNALGRAHVLEVDEAAFIDSEAVEQHLADQAERITAAKALVAAADRRAEGKYTIEEEALEAEHLDGQHAAGLRDGCPSCDAEKIEQAAEAEPAGKAKGRTRKSAS